MDLVETIRHCEAGEVTLLRPEYDKLTTPFIRREYLPGLPRGRGKNGLPAFDISSAGSGLLQVLLLLAYFRPDD